MNPLDYSLCDQTVTVYRKDGEGILRQVAENCHLDRQDRTIPKSYGKSMEKRFLLIIPGSEVCLQPGDRIYAGIGPAHVDWEHFIPALVPELYEVSYARPCCWEGQIAHWEAGHKEVP